MGLEPAERIRDCGPPTIDGTHSRCGQDDEVGTPVTRVSCAPDVASVDEATEVVAQSRRRNAGREAQMPGGDRLQHPNPAEEREQLRRHTARVQFSLDERRNQRPGGVRLLDEDGVRIPTNVVTHLLNLVQSCRYFIAMSTMMRIVAASAVVALAGTVAAGAATRPRFSVPYD